MPGGVSETRKVEENDFSIFQVCFTLKGYSVHP